VLPLEDLKEYRRPPLPPSLVPKTTALQRDPDHHPHHHNFDRAHTARPTKRRMPADIVLSARKTRPMR
jgi:hypothetical protein